MIYFKTFFFLNFSTWEPRKNILDKRLIEAYEKKKKANKKEIELKKEESSDDDYSDKSIDYNELLDVTKSVNIETKDEIKLFNRNGQFTEQTEHTEDLNCRLPNKRPILIEEEKKEDLAYSFSDETNEEDSTILDDLNESADFQSDEHDKTDLSQNNQNANLNDSNSDTLDDSYENDLVIDTTIEDSNDNSNDNSINDLNLNIKRKIDSTDFNYESIDFNKKSSKYNEHNKQFNQRADQIEIKKFLDNRFNQSTENSFYPELDNSDFSDKNEFNQESNCANKFKSFKPDFLKKKSSLLDLVTVTDVIANNQKITIRESKSHKFFFKDKKSTNTC